MRKLGLMIAALCCIWLMSAEANAATPGSTFMTVSRQGIPLKFINSMINAEGVITGTVAVHTQNSPYFTMTKRFYCGEQKLEVLSVNGADLPSGIWKPKPKSDAYKMGVFFCRLYSKEF
jgi:hypothetical protein